MSAEEDEFAPDDLEDRAASDRADANAPEEPEKAEPDETVAKAEKALTEVERVASQLGWIPQEEFRGPKERWRPAEDFLRTGVEIGREFKSRMEAKDRDFNERVRRSERMAEQALVRQRQQLEDNYKAQLRYAASQGDVEVYTAVEKARDQAIESFEKETAPVRQPAPERDSSLAPETVTFVERNASWFNRDPVMTGAAVALCGELQEKYGDKVPLGSIMTMVENQIREEFPHKFKGGTNHERGPQRVEGGQRAIKTSAKKGWDHLPSEAKQAGKKFIEQGIFGKDPAKAKQAYADDYWGLGD